MARICRDFFARRAPERTWILENSWCGRCELPDLGVEEPVEYEERGRVYLEGLCPICHGRVALEIVDQRQGTRTG